MCAYAGVCVSCVFNSFCCLLNCVAYFWGLFGVWCLRFFLLMPLSIMKHKIEFVFIAFTLSYCEQKKFKKIPNCPNYLLYFFVFILNVDVWFLVFGAFSLSFWFRNVFLKNTNCDAIFFCLDSNLQK